MSSPECPSLLRLCRPPLRRPPVMDGCEHHSRRSKRNDSDAIPEKETHPLPWCILAVWCSLLYLSLSSLANCHRRLLLFALPAGIRTLNTLPWSYLKELCFGFDLENWPALIQSGRAALSQTWVTKCRCLLCHLEDAWCSSRKIGRRNRQVIDNYDGLMT